jgi:hypothetical protein
MTEVLLFIGAAANIVTVIALVVIVRRTSKGDNIGHKR